MDVYPITFPLGERQSRVFVFQRENEVGVFDAGCRGDGTNHIIPELIRRGVSPADVRWVIASHPDVDHFGGLDDFAAWAPQAKRIAHVLDQPLMESMKEFFSRRGDELAPFGCPETAETAAWLRENGAEVSITFPVDGDDSLVLGDQSVDVLHLPGHSRGHLAVWVAEEQALAISDALLGDSVPYRDGRPSFPPPYRYVDAYLTSIARVRTLSPHVLLTAHYGTFEGREVASFLDVSERFALALEEHIIEVIGQRALTVTEIISAVDESFGVWPKPTAHTALGQPVMGHLERLEATGLIHRRGAGKETTWQRGSTS